MQMENIVFNMAVYAIKNSAEDSQVTEFYYPESLKNLVKRHCVSDGNIFYIIETIMPDRKGSIDSTGFYIPSDDTGNWVDGLLIRLEEERIANELNQMEENLEEGLEIPEINYAEEIEKVFSDEIQAKELTDKNQVLKFMEYDREIFIPQKTAEGYVIIHSAGDRTTRNFYDDNYQVNTKELWKIPGVASAELLQTENFEYEEETGLLTKKIVTTKNKESVFVYNEEKLVIENCQYTIYKDEKYLTAKSNYKYTEDKQIEEDTTRTYSYNTDFTKQTDSFSKKYIYTYNEDEEIPPDFEYYEEDELKMKNKYSVEKGNYTSQIFFDEDFAVKTYYEDGVRVKDVYTKADKVIRIKDYEN